MHSVSVLPLCYLFQVYNVHYTMSINGKVQDGSMEIDAGNNLETFKTGSGSEEAVEVHDFQIVSTATGSLAALSPVPTPHCPSYQLLGPSRSSPTWIRLHQVWLHARLQVTEIDLQHLCPQKHSRKTL